MTSVRKSLFFSFAEQYSVTAIQFGASLVLARLLSPAEIGVFSVGAAIIALAHALRDFGVSNYIIQEKTLTELQSRAALGVTLVIAWPVALLFFVLSDTIATFYNEPGVKQVIMLLSCNFLLLPLGTVGMAILRRKMSFDKIFHVNLISAVIQSVVSITMAFMGFSFMSLAWGGVANVLVSVILVNLYQSNVILPSFQGFKNIFRFGAYSSIASLAIEFGNSAPDIVIGRVLGFNAVGLFSRGMGLVTLFNRVVSSAVYKVSVPMFARKNRINLDLRDSYILTINYLLGLAWPFYSFLGLTAYPIIDALYGSQWTPAVPIVQILCLSFSISLIPIVGSWVLVAKGEITSNMIARCSWELSKFVLILIACLINLNAVALAVAISNIIGFSIYFLVIRKNIKIKLRDYNRIILKNLAVMAIAVFIPVIVKINDPNFSLLSSSFMIAFFGTVVGWLIGLFVFSHPLKDEILKLKETVTNFVAPTTKA